MSHRLRMRPVLQSPALRRMSLSASEGPAGVERVGHVRINAAVSRYGTLRLAPGGHLERPRLEALDDLA